MSCQIASREAEIYITTSEAAELMRVSERHVRRQAEEGRLKFTIGAGRGGNAGEQYLIDLNSLPAEAAARRFTGNNIIEQRMPLNNTPKTNKQKAEKYAYILSQTEGLRGNQLKSWIAKYNENCKTPSEKTCYRSVMYARNGQIKTKHGSRRGITKIKPEWMDFFKRIYLLERGGSLWQCWSLTRGYALQSGYPQSLINYFPCVKTFKRQLDKQVSISEQYYARMGREAWNRKYSLYLNRNIDDIYAGQVYFSDHHQLDIAVMDKNGSSCFPWLTVWRDWKSGKWLGWYLHIEPPCADHIFLSFYYAAVRFGLPEVVYMDNGKDYRCKDFGGGKKHWRLALNEGQVASLTANLGIRPMFAEAYNGQTKPIERDFRIVKDSFGRFLVGYRGGHVRERPEKLKREIERQEIMPFDYLSKALDKWILQVFNEMPRLHSKFLKGLSPNQMWDKCHTVQRRIDEDALKLFCMRSSQPKTIRRNGIEDSELGIKLFYWSEWMAPYIGSGEKFYLRRDPKKYQEAWVFTESDDFVGTAKAGLLDVPGLALTDTEKTHLKEAARIKKRHESTLRKMNQNKPLGPLELISRKEASIAVSRKRIIKADTVIDVTPTKMDKVLQEKEKMEKQDTQDLSLLAIPEEKEKEPLIFLSETERDEYFRTLKEGKK